jgi:hypothetical protein
MQLPVIPSAGWGPVFTPLCMCRIPGETGPQPALGITKDAAFKCLLFSIILSGLQQAHATHARVHNARHAFGDVLFREVITVHNSGCRRAS